MRCSTTGAALVCTTTSLPLITLTYRSADAELMPNTSVATIVAITRIGRFTNISLAYVVEVKRLPSLHHD